MAIERFNFDPMAHFQIGDGAVTLTEMGQQFAGSSQYSAHARGEMLAGMAVRVMNRIEQPSPSADDVQKSTWLYEEAMPAAAEAARPPLTEGDKELFMAGARQILIGGNA